MQLVIEAHPSHSTCQSLCSGVAVFWNRSVGGRFSGNNQLPIGLVNNKFLFISRFKMAVINGHQTRPRIRKYYMLAQKNARNA